jgi:hypothetical protein
VAPVTGMITMPRAESRSIPRSARTVIPTEQTRERTKHGPLRAQEANDTAADLAAARNMPAETVAPVAQVIEKPVPSEGVAPTVHPAPEVVSAPDAAPATTPVVASLPVVQQGVRPEPAPVGPSQGPKSREEVRAELERARTDGSLPRFGNPDPAGPGVSTISKVLPATATH